MNFKVFISILSLFVVQISMANVISVRKNVPLGTLNFECNEKHII